VLGKVTFKSNIALLPKKVTNCDSYFLWKVMLHYFCITFSHLGLLVFLFFFDNKKSSIFGKCSGSFTPKVKWINLRLKEIHIYVCTVKGAAQTNLSAVLQFWIERRIGYRRRKFNTLISKSNLKWFLLINMVELGHWRSAAKT